MKLQITDFSIQGLVDQLLVGFKVVNNHEGVQITLLHNHMPSLYTGGTPVVRLGVSSASTPITSDVNMRPG